MNYLKMNKEDVCNGEGLRVVLWLSGCSHKCKGCQNPQTWNANSGIPFDEQAKEELFRELNKDYISGLTLTGGDPLFESNLDNVLDLVNEFRLSFPMKSIWIYSGYKFEDCILKDKVCEENISRALRYEIIKQCTVMVDGQYIDSQKDISLPYRGSKNQRLINVKESIEKGEVILWKC